MPLRSYFLHVTRPLSAFTDSSLFLVRYVRLHESVHGCFRPNPTPRKLGGNGLFVPTAVDFYFHTFPLAPNFSKVSGDPFQCVGKMILTLSSESAFEYIRWSD